MKPLISFLLAWVLISRAPAQELFTNIGHIKEGLSAITGLAFKHDVPYALIDKDAPEVVREHIEALTVQLDRILADGVEAGELRASALGGAMAIWDATTRFHHPAHRSEWADPRIGEYFEGVWELVLRGLAKE